MDWRIRKRPGQETVGLQALRQQDEEAFVAVAAELAAFVRERGREPGRRTDDLSEAGLGAWLDRQRAADRRGRLSPARSMKLGDVLGPAWSSTHRGDGRLRPPGDGGRGEDRPVRVSGGAAAW